MACAINLYDCLTPHDYDTIFQERLFQLHNV